jgi:hypothetical protein
MLRRNFRLSLSLFALLALSVSLLPKAANAQAFSDYTDFVAATSSLTMESFDSSPWILTANPQGTSNLGVTWTSNNVLYVTTVVFKSFPQSLSDLDGSPDLVDTIHAAMPSGITAVGGWIGTFAQGHMVSMTAYAADDAVLGTIDAPSTGLSDSSFVGLITSAPIAKVSFISTSGGIADDFWLDDFVFGTGHRNNQVPEPGTLAFLGGMAAGAILLVRARRNR